MGMRLVQKLPRPHLFPGWKCNRAGHYCLARLHDVLALNYGLISCTGQYFSRYLHYKCTYGDWDLMSCYVKYL